MRTSPPRPSEYAALRRNQRALPRRRSKSRFTKFDSHIAAKGTRGLAERFDGQACIAVVEQTIQVGPAGVGLLRQRFLGHAFGLHRLRKLPSDDTLDRNCGGAFEETLIRKEFIEAR